MGITETTNYVCHLIFQFPSFLTAAIKKECKGCQGVGNIPVCQNTKPPIKEQQPSGDRLLSFTLEEVVYNLGVAGIQYSFICVCVDT